MLKLTWEKKRRRRILQGINLKWDSRNFLFLFFSPLSSRSYQMMNLLLYKLFHVITEISALFELNGLFLSHSTVIKVNDGKSTMYSDIYSVIKWGNVMMDVLWALWFWEKTAKAGYLSLNRCHKRRQWDAGKLGEAVSRFWRDCGEGQVTAEVSRLFSFRSEQAPLYSTITPLKENKGLWSAGDTFPRTK